jgi:hypothetical protein
MLRWIFEVMNLADRFYFIVPHCILLDYSVVAAQAGGLCILDDPLLLCRANCLCTCASVCVCGFWLCNHFSSLG